jgi:hypothetical protein
VIWDFAGEDFSPDLVSALETFRSALGTGFSATLRDYLTPEELTALEARLVALLACPVFLPPSENRRSFPYPPV